MKFCNCRKSYVFKYTYRTISECDKDKFNKIKLKCIYMKTIIINELPNTCVNNLSCYNYHFEHLNATST
jgi:hypothetical protein